MILSMKKNLNVCNAAHRHFSYVTFEAVHIFFILSELKAISWKMISLLLELYSCLAFPLYFIYFRHIFSRMNRGEKNSFQSFSLIQFV